MAVTVVMQKEEVKEVRNGILQQDSYTAVDRERMYFRAEMTKHGSCFLRFQMPYFSVAIQLLMSLLQYYSVHRLLWLSSIQSCQPLQSQYRGITSCSWYTADHFIGRPALPWPKYMKPKTTVAYPLHGCPKPYC